MVTRTAPGTTVPVKIVRAKKVMTLNVTVEELDVDAEQGSEARSRRTRKRAEQPRETGFGMTIEPIATEIARQSAPAAGRTGGRRHMVERARRHAEGLRPGDVIVTEVNAATSVDEVTTALDRVAVGRNARVVVLRVGHESLVLMRKR